MWIKLRNVSEYQTIKANSPVVNRNYIVLLLRFIQVSKWNTYIQQLIRITHTLMWYWQTCGWPGNSKSYANSRNVLQIHKYIVYQYEHIINLLWIVANNSYQYSWLIFTQWSGFNITDILTCILHSFTPKPDRHSISQNETFYNC